MGLKIYLDIDGVLLPNETHLAHYADEFLELITSKFDVYWLTTHCMVGDASWAVEYVRRVCKPSTTELLKRIKPLSWKTAKTEAIEFNEPFLWFDDDLYPEEREELTKRSAIDNWIQIDLSKNENQLAEFIRSFPIPVKPIP